MGLPEPDYLGPNYLGPNYLGLNYQVEEHSDPEHQLEHFPSEQQMVRLQDRPEEHSTPLVEPRSGQQGGRWLPLAQPQLDQRTECSKQRAEQHQAQIQDLRSR
jgi:hypothetical protein